MRAKLPSDRKSTRLNSSHSQISYAVFCLKKKKKNNKNTKNNTKTKKQKKILQQHQQCQLHCQHHSIFFFNDPATTEIYTLSLHDALPIYGLPSSPWSRLHYPVRQRE